MRALRARGGAVIGTLVVCALVLTGCAAGKKAPTSEETPAIDGTNASIGQLLLREVAIAAPADYPSYAQGANANLQLVIVNTGAAADALTGVTTPAAASVTHPAAGSTSGTPTTSPTGSSSTSAPGSSSSAAAGPFAPVAIGPNGRVAFNVGTGGPSLVLNSLTAQLFPATVVSITFTFQNAGSVTVQVPVQLTQSEDPTRQVVTAGETTESTATE